MVFKTKEEAYNFLVSAGIIRPNERKLEGAEKNEMWLILQLIESTHSTNNQRFITEHYTYGDKGYQVTFFDEKDFEIVEISK
jgi:hypothetical protein